MISAGSAALFRPEQTISGIAQARRVSAALQPPDTAVLARGGSHLRLQDGTLTVTDVAGNTSAFGAISSNRGAMFEFANGAVLQWGAAVIVT